MVASPWRFVGERLGERQGPGFVRRHPIRAHATLRKGRELARKLVSRFQGLPGLDNTVGKTHSERFIAGNSQRN